MEQIEKKSVSKIQKNMVHLDSNCIWMETDKNKENLNRNNFELGTFEKEKNIVFCGCQC